MASSLWCQHFVFDVKTWHPLCHVTSTAFFLWHNTMTFCLRRNKSLRGASCPEWFAVMAPWHTHHHSRHQNVLSSTTFTDGVTFQLGWWFFSPHFLFFFAEVPNQYGLSRKEVKEREKMNNLHCYLLRNIKKAFGNRWGVQRKRVNRFSSGH